ncbi:MAG: RraA family protein [Verrucomicrobiia bacterium]|jgi:regulator of RNase E activity RraA
MKRISHLIPSLVLGASLASVSILTGATAAELSADATAFRAGTNFIPTRVFSAEEDQRLLKAFEGLRVADVCDGMDAVGLHNKGLMDPEIRPLWRDTERFTHRFTGIAVTVRYVPTQEPPAGNRPIEDYDRWVSQWYQEKSSEPFQSLLRPGTALVIEDATEADVGSIGSNNIMSWKLKGCVGVVTGATARDTDEVITEKIPLYFRRPGRGIRPGRNEVESVNRPVVVGGMLVKPGDVIVADGDGVIVVPRDKAVTVAAYSRKILEGDKVGRRNLYRQLGLPEDPSVK